MGEKRQIEGLRHAARLGAKPRSIPIGRPRGAKAFGVRYEKALERELGLGALPRFERGIWFEFEDRNGPGYCQVDFLSDEVAGDAVVLECKYSWTELGHLELETLYRPVVERALGVEVFGIVVCKNLAEGMREAGARVFGEASSALAFAKSGGRSVRQWLPKTPMGPFW